MRKSTGFQFRNFTAALSGGRHNFVEPAGGEVADAVVTVVVRGGGAWCVVRGGDGGAWVTVVTTTVSVARGV